MNRQIYSLLFTLISICSYVYPQVQLKGFVFYDKNKDGIQNDREPGLKDIPVSNGKDIVLTDRKGLFHIVADSNDVIFIMQPSGWKVPVNDYNIPQYYKNIRLKKGPDYLKYKGFTDPIPLPEKLAFPLYKSKNRGDKIRAIISGDPQPRDSAEVRYFRMKF